MNILVCGSEGSLMQDTIPHLLGMGHNVRGVDNFFKGRVEHAREYEFIEGDLCDVNLVKKVSKGIDIVFQAAAQLFGLKGFHKYPADILSKDVVLHQNILWEALNSNIQKVVFISSSMVFERTTKIPSEEDDVDDIPTPLTDYGLSKLVGERLCKAFHQQYGLRYTIWRPFNIITPKERAEEEPGIAHVFADFIKKIIVERQNPVEVFGDGEQIRCFTWVGDVASAIAKYSLESVTDCEVFNLGNPEPTTMKELALKIYEMARKEGLIKGEGELKFKYLPAFEDDVKFRVPAISKARKMLGWQPTVELDEALKRCVLQSRANM